MRRGQGRVPGGGLSHATQAYGTLQTRRIRGLSRNASVVGADPVCVCTQTGEDAREDKEPERFREPVPAESALEQYQPDWIAK